MTIQDVTDLAYQVELTFEAIRGGSYWSDIALDDITITSGMCPGKLVTMADGLGFIWLFWWCFRYQLVNENGELSFDALSTWSSII